jgi:hypothetical protein
MNIMSKPITIGLIATNGSVIKKILWFRHTGKEFFYGYAITGLDIHRSYHEDGTTHWKIKEINSIKPTQTILPVKFKPLNEFEGIFHLGTLAFPFKNLEGYDKPDYGMREYDDIIFIDVRSIGHKETLNVHSYLLEPNKMELIPKFRGKSHIHIITTTMPWIVIIENKFLLESAS